MGQQAGGNGKVAINCRSDFLLESAVQPFLQRGAQGVAGVVSLAQRFLTRSGHKLWTVITLLVF